MELVFQIVLLLFSIAWMFFGFVIFVRALADLKDISQADTSDTENERGKL